jgi:hypothetical protein
LRLFSLFPPNRPRPIGKTAKKSRDMMSAGTTAQPSGQNQSAALSFPDDFPTAGCALPPLMFAAFAPRERRQV